MDPDGPSLSLPDDADARGAREVVHRLRAAGHVAYIAGGAVRDLLLGRRPKDYDVATDADPDAVAALFPRSVPVGAQFGITRVILDGHEYEVARFRAEGPREDVLHRDFTLNGLLLDPATSRVLDFVGGAADLAARRLRACGHDPDGRFAEDALRVLRAARFAAHFELSIDAATRAALHHHAPRVAATSAERQRDELARILTGPRPAMAFALLAELGLDRALLPELPDPARARTRLAALHGAPEAVGWTTLGLDWPSAAPATALGQRLRWSTRLTRQVATAIALVAALPAYPDATVATRKRWIRDADAPTALAAADAAVTATADPALARGLALAHADAARWSQAELHPAALLDGRALTAAGLRPGPRFKPLLDAVEDATLEGRVATPADALALALALASTQRTTQEPKR